MGGRIGFPPPEQKKKPVFSIEMKWGVQITILAPRFYLQNLYRPPAPSHFERLAYGKYIGPAASGPGLALVDVAQRVAWQAVPYAPPPPPPVPCGDPTNPVSPPCVCAHAVPGAAPACKPAAAAPCRARC